jgi:hypothetical protein
MNPSLYDILIFSKIIPLVLAILILQKRIFRSSYKFLLLFLLNSLITDVIGLILSNNKINTLLLYNIYTVTEFIILSYFFSSNYSISIFIKTSKITRILILVILILDILFVSGVDTTLNGYSSAFESVIIAGFSVFLFIEMALGYPEIYPLKNGLFFINAALFFYFFTSPIYFIIFQYALKNNPYGFTMMINIHAINYAFSNIILTFGLWITSSNFRQSST